MRPSILAVLLTCLATSLLALAGCEQAAQMPAATPAASVTAGMIAVAYNLPGVDGLLNLPQDVYVVMRWILTDGQTYAEALWYVPLPDNVVEAALAKLGAVGT